MKPEHWGQIERLYHAALERASDERAAFLDAACKDDQDLRREVESLLSYDEQAQHFIESPPDTMAAEMFAAEQAPALVGENVSHYQILSLLGRGGMGVVYLAQDTNLGRKIALKLLPEQFTKDTEQVRRFEREARAASALNHPNIITIHEIGETATETGSLRYIATEFVEGETLRQKMASAPQRRMKPPEAIKVALQIAAALAAAHEAGITHRDIKPENVMVRRDGIVKVLDFGLAKLTESAPPVIDSQAPTIVRNITDAGVVMGTPRYMSPEQARGEKVDERTDIFSLGVMLYEMVAGRRPFEGQTASDCIAALLTAEPPPLRQSQPETPAELERIINKCLVKEREGRYSSAQEMLTDLRNLKRKSDQGVTINEEAPSRQERGFPRFTFAIITVAILTLAGFGFYIFSPRDETINSVAVLPFANESADPQMEYLSDGITESLINSLSQLPKLRVIARTTVFRYKGRKVDPMEIGRELNVRVVLTGKVLQRGEGLSIQADLVDVTNEAQLWGENYNRPIADIFAVQSDITRQISEKMRFRLTAEEEKRLAKRYTDNSKAYHLYLKGRYFWNKRSQDELRKAIEYFQQAVDLDQNYALAHAGLADAYVLAIFPLPPREKIPKAKAEAIRALELDPNLAQAHTSLARAMYMYDHEWEKAKQEFERAIELNPNYETAHHWYAEYLVSLGQSAKAISEAKRALDADPLSLVVNWNLGNTFYLAREFDQAIEQFRKTLELDPRFHRARADLIRVYEQQGKYDDALAEEQRLINLTGGSQDRFAALREAYAASGPKGYWREKLARLRGTPQPIPNLEMAMIYARLNEKDQAIAWLEKAEQEREQMLVWLKAGPMWDNLRSDPRFTALMQRVGLKP